MLFSSKLRDRLVTIQPKIQLFDNWITDRTEQLRPLVDLGITEVDKWGGFSPLQSMAILMEGWNDALHLAEPILPKSGFTRGMLLNMLYGILRGDSFDKQTNFGVIMENIPVQFLAAKNVADWVENIGDGLEKLFKLKEPIKAMSSEHEIIQATEAGGTPVILNKGAAIPFNEIILVDGKLYLVIGRTGRDEDYGAGAEEMFAGFKRMGNALKNMAFVDNIEGALVIPFEEARKAVMPLDPDPNMWEVFKVAALLASVAAAVTWPTSTMAAAAVGIVTAKGMVGAGLSSIWNWIGVAASQVIANGLRILPFVSGYEPGTKQGEKYAELVEKSMKIEAGMAPFGDVTAPSGKYSDYLIEKSAELVMRGSYSSTGALVAVLQAAKDGVFGDKVIEYIGSPSGNKRFVKNFFESIKKIQGKVVTLKEEREKVEGEQQGIASVNKKDTSRMSGILEILRLLAADAATG